MAARTLDAGWLAEHPLPSIEEDGDKNSRGRLLLVGGSGEVPGAVRLTGEAALRAGAGKLLIATIGAACAPLGVAVPEAAVIALPEEGGEIGAGAGARLEQRISRSDALVVGPAMGSIDAAARLLAELLANPPEGLYVLLDAAAIGAAAGHKALLAPFAGRLVMTPHHGEMAKLCGCTAEDVAARPDAIARDVAASYGAVIALKDARTWIAAPDGGLLSFASECPGLGVAGSGDVLAGVIGGLLARGAEPLRATAWGVWLHAHAGKEAARRIGQSGFLARELLPLIPALMGD